MSNIIDKQIYAKVSASLSKPAAVKEFSDYVKKFINRNSEVLLTPYPVERLAFRDSDKEIMYKLADIDEKEIKAAVKNIKFINSSWKALNNPFNFLMLCFIKHFAMKKDKENTELAIVYTSMQFYGMHHVRYLRYVQKETMIYTITHLSNKHDIKTHGTVFKAIYKKSLVNHETYIKNIQSDDDKKLIDYIVNLNNRIKQWVIGIMLEYKENKNSGKYFNATSDELDDEENYRETTNTSMEVIKLANNISMQTVKHPTNIKISKIASDLSGVNGSSLIRTLNDIRKEENPELILEFIKLIIELYIIEGEKSLESIASRDYILYTLKIYNRSNTIDERVLRIKEILDIWLAAHSEAYLKTNRVATKINWKKSIFIYYSLLIQYYYVN